MISNTYSSGADQTPLHKHIKIHPELLNRIIDFYQLPVKTALPAQSGYRNTSIPLPLKLPLDLTAAGDYPLAAVDKVNLILFKDEPRILTRRQNASRITSWLAKQGFPVRLMLGPLPDPKTNKIAPSSKILAISRPSQQPASSKTKKRLAGVFTFLPGETISWDAYTQKHLKLAGQMMSQLHTALARMPEKIEQHLPKQAVELATLSRRMKQYFQQPAVRTALDKKLSLSINPDWFSAQKKILEALTQIKTSQALHMDFVRSNLLFQQQPAAALADKPAQQKFSLDYHSTQSDPCLAISGVLDFEKAAVGPKIIDIARTMAFLLVDCKYKTDQQIRKYFLHSGYRKRGSSDLSNLELLNPLISFFWSYDFYKFLRHNPYQFLPKNQHFVRTKQFLLERNIVSE